jgi:hypothetical protein
MGRIIKILTVLLIFSLTASVVIYYLLGWGKYVDMSPILKYMFISIYGGSFAAILLTSEKFGKLSSKQLGFKFFAISCTLSLVIFAAISYLIGSTFPIYFKPGVTHEQAQRAYFNNGILTFIRVKMIVGTFTGMLLAIKTTDIKGEKNQIKLHE